MTIKELKEAIQNLPDDMEVNIKVSYYNGGSITGGVIPHVESISDEDVEGHSVDKYFNLECTVFM